MVYITIVKGDDGKERLFMLRGNKLADVLDTLNIVGSERNTIAFTEDEVKAVIVSERVIIVHDM